MTWTCHLTPPSDRNPRLVPPGEIRSSPGGISYFFSYAVSFFNYLS